MPRRTAPGPTTSAASRIEIADLKERIRKLEAIAAGVDPLTTAVTLAKAGAHLPGFEPGCNGMRWVPAFAKVTKSWQAPVCRYIALMTSFSDISNELNFLEGDDQKIALKEIGEQLEPMPRP